MILDETEIIRIFELCQEILDVQKELPLPPQGVDVRANIAKALRPILLERHAPALRELARMLG